VLLDVPDCASPQPRLMNRQGVVRKQSSCRLRIESFARPRHSHSRGEHPGIPTTWKVKRGITMERNNDVKATTVLITAILDSDGLEIKM
jgi:hypothetical protein